MKLFKTHRCASVYRGLPRVLPKETVGIEHWQEVLSHAHISLSLDDTADVLRAGTHEALQRPIFKLSSCHPKAAECSTCQTFLTSFQPALMTHIHTTCSWSSRHSDVQVYILRHTHTRAIIWTVANAHTHMLSHVPDVNISAYLRPLM